MHLKKPWGIYYPSGQSRMESEHMSYNRRQLSVLFDSLGYYKPHAVIIGGAAMVMHGLLETTRDLDVALPAHIMSYHEGEGKAIKQDPDFVPARYRPSGCEGIDFCTGGTEYVASAANVVVVDGLPVLARPALLSFYQKLNRPKDQEKIRILQQVLEQLKIAREALFSRHGPNERCVQVTLETFGAGVARFVITAEEANNLLERNAGELIKPPSWV